jgi:hypothetical protein
MRERIKAHLKRHFSIYAILTNILCALCVAAFAVLGLLSNILSTSMLVGNALVFGLVYAISKFGDETLDDMGKGCDKHD